MGRNLRHAQTHMQMQRPALSGLSATSNASVAGVRRRSWDARSYAELCGTCSTSQRAKLMYTVHDVVASVSSITFSDLSKSRSLPLPISALEPGLRRCLDGCGGNAKHRWQRCLLCSQKGLARGAKESERSVPLTRQTPHRARSKGAACERALDPAPT